MCGCVCVCVEERESEGGKERNGRTAARISPITGEGPRGGTEAGILLDLSHPRKFPSLTRSTISFSFLLPVSRRDFGKDHQDLQPPISEMAQWINCVVKNHAACGMN